MFDFSRQLNQMVSSVNHMNILDISEKWSECIVFQTKINHDFGNTSDSKQNPPAGIITAGKDKFLDKEPHSWILCAGCHQSRRCICRPDHWNRFYPDCKNLWWQNLVGFILTNLYYNEFINYRQILRQFFFTFYNPLFITIPWKYNNKIFHRLIFYCIMSYYLL